VFAHATGRADGQPELELGRRSLARNFIVTGFAAGLAIIEAILAEAYLH
jgi:hypothetical protein